MTHETTILVVEDDPDIRELLEQLLSDEGYDVHVAADGEAALDELEHRDTAVMLLDLMLPRISGTDMRPFDVYSRPSDTPATSGGKPLIAIVVSGLGLNTEGPLEAISKLPEEVTLAVAGGTARVVLERALQLRPRGLPRRHEAEHDAGEH